MGAVKINGTTSGFTQLVAAAVADSETLTLPNGGGTLLPMEGGKILQIVRATDSTQRSTTSTTFVDVTGMSVTITPQKSDSAILIIATGKQTALASGGTNVCRSDVQITDSSGNAISGAEQNELVGTPLSNGEMKSPMVLIAYATPATTDPVTYKLRHRVFAANRTSRIDNNENTGQMYAIEVSA
jgi:hypothetical protein